MRLTARLIDRSRLSRAERGAMLRLMQRHYEHVRPDVFFHDLDEKRWVIAVYELTGQLCGFSTQTLLSGQTGSEHFRALFSGDTIIDREHWGDPALSHAWGSLALALIDGYADRPLYWFLLSQGYRTYRFLPLFFHEFYPRHDVATPAASKEIINSLATARYGKSYDRASGVVRSHPQQYWLRSELGDVRRRLVDPHVRFFAHHNPGHAAGDELCCLAPLTRENFTRAAWRVIGPEPALELV
jgi:hypothetical protein